MAEEEKMSFEDVHNRLKTLSLAQDADGIVQFASYIEQDNCNDNNLIALSNAYRANANRKTMNRVSAFNSLGQVESSDHTSAVP